LWVAISIRQNLVILEMAGNDNVRAGRGENSARYALVIAGKTTHFFKAANSLIFWELAGEQECRAAQLPLKAALPGAALRLKLAVAL
jgi:hypothetical protein